MSVPMLSTLDAELLVSVGDASLLGKGVTTGNISVPVDAGRGQDTHAGQIEHTSGGVADNSSSGLAALFGLA
jgi:hypothetical protein